VPSASGLSFTWHERGVNMPVGEPGRGFENVLLGAVVEKQLGGQITRDWRTDADQIGWSEVTTLSNALIAVGDTSLRSRL